MRTIGAILFCAFCLVQSAAAQDSPIKLDGESFAKQFVGNPPNGDKLMEFVKETETFEKWTKLIGVRYQQLPGAGNEPKRVAQGMAQIVKATNPKANSSIIANESSSEAIIDFLTWPPSGEYLEFNVFRYVKSKGGNGVISVQFAKRFTSDTAPTIDQLKSLRKSWVYQAAELDMRVVHDLLGK
ncbi:MAG: hypothetical protein K8F26_13510 [Thiobacillus sp.]|nr:hypothetical protein [Thiobacillus sp.]